MPITIAVGDTGCAAVGAGDAAQAAATVRGIYTSLSAGASADYTLVMLALVAAQCLAGRKSLVADGARVRPAT